MDHIVFYHAIIALVKVTYLEGMMMVTTMLIKNTQKYFNPFLILLSNHDMDDFFSLSSELESDNEAQIFPKKKDDNQKIRPKIKIHNYFSSNHHTFLKREKKYSE